jgi:hypothetical protein
MIFSRVKWHPISGIFHSFIKISEIFKISEIWFFNPQVDLLAAHRTLLGVLSGRVTKYPRLTCKPHSVRQEGIHKGRLPPGRLSLWAVCYHPARAAYPELRGNEQPPARRGGLVPAWLCSRWGMSGCDITAAPVVSYTAFSPLPLLAEGRTISVTLSSKLLRSGRYPAPCSVECGLSSTLPKQSRNRPVNLGQSHDTRMSAFRQLEL